MDSYKIILEPTKPIPVTDLKIGIIQGKDLYFPLTRMDLLHRMSDYFNKHIVNMAQKGKTDLAWYGMHGPRSMFDNEILHIASINTLYRYNDAMLNENNLNLKLGVTDFREWIGTSVQAAADKDFCEDMHRAGIADDDNAFLYFSLPLSNCAAIVTSDSKVAVGLRSEKVAYLPNTYHVVGGMCRTKNKIDFSEMREELVSEMGIFESNISKADFVGMVADKKTGDPELMYIVFLGMDEAGLRDSWQRKAPDKYEHKKLEFVDREKLRGFIDDNYGRIVPSGEATLEAYLKYY